MEITKIYLNLERVNFSTSNPQLRPFIFLMMALMSMSLLFGYLNIDRPVAGHLLVQCDEYAPIEAQIHYGRFTQNTAHVTMTSSALPAPEKIKLPGRYVFRYPHPLLFKSSFYLLVHSVSKSSTLKSLDVVCNGLKKAIRIDEKFQDSFEVPITDGKISYEWPREGVMALSPGYWFGGFFVITLMLLFLCLEINTYLKKDLWAEKIIPFLILALMGISYIYYFPGFISPFNPTSVLLINGQVKIVSGYEGALYSLLFNSIVEFIPKIEVAVLTQNLLVFLAVSRLVLLGQSVKQKYILLFAIIFLSFLSPWTHLYVQYLERGVFTSYCFIIYLLTLFSCLLNDASYFEKKKSRAFKLLFFSILLVLLRNEFLVVLLPILFFCFRIRRSKIIAVAVFLIVSVLSNKYLDSLDKLGSGWRFRYNIVSLTGYFVKIAHIHEFTEEEKNILTKYMDIDALKNTNSVWVALKAFPVGTQEDLFDLVKIIARHFKQDPMAIILSRAAFAFVSLGTGPFPPWLYTAPNRGKMYSEEIALTAELLGSIKTPGDPFYEKSYEIYQDAGQQPPFGFSFGVIFILAGIFLFSFIPVTSLICWALTTKLIVVALLAPVHAMHYVYDIYWFCILVLPLAWFEFRRRKNLLNAKTNC